MGNVEVLFPELISLFSEWLEEIRSESTRSFAENLVPVMHRVAKIAPLEAVWFVSHEPARREVRPIIGGGRLPQILVDDVAEKGEVISRGNYVGIPVGQRGVPAGVLVFQVSDEWAGKEGQRLGAILRGILQAIWEYVGLNKRVSRQQRIVEAAQRWITLRDWSQLFEDIATSATRILGCERATIFLWDRRAKLLIGRPALGVPGGQLVLPDDRGIVGRVIRSGQPARADSEVEPTAIDRSVDRRLGFRTRNVLCVPLCGKQGLQGAFEVLNKQQGTFDEDDERTLVEIAGFAAAALENAQEHQALLATTNQFISEAAAEVEMVGESAAIENIRRLIRRVADTDLTVLILGENGTGKEVVARLIHFNSQRRRFPFLAVNCAAIPEALAESELFGHERGAFTDAVQTRPGKFELAGKGTLFLDEVGELSLACQAKLLRVLEERMFVRVGGSTPLPAEARVIAATNQDLSELVRSKRFREDLYYRLNGVVIEVPPLRARREDIIPLARHFLHKFCTRARRPTLQLTPAAEEFLTSYSWPGNVRELRNAVERLTYLVTSDVVDVDDLRFLVGAPRTQGIRFDRQAAADMTGPLPPSWGEFASAGLAEATWEFQRRLIAQVLTETGGNLTEAARRLRLHRSNFYRKLRQLGMSLPQLKRKT